MFLTKMLNVSCSCNHFSIDIEIAKCEDSEV